MGGWGTWLLAMVGPAAKRILVSLGLSVVTYAGVSTAVNAMIDSAKQNMAGLPADVANMIALAGINTALSIITGAIVARVSLVALKKLQWN